MIMEHPLNVGQIKWKKQERRNSMKFKKWKELNNFVTDEDMRLFFHRNLINGFGVMAMAVCPTCDEILNNYECYHCPNCYPKVIEESERKS